MEINLINTIKADCQYYEKLQNGFVWLELIECSNSKESGLYQLTKNEEELWYGTLQEINAIVKTLIKLEKSRLLTGVVFFYPFTIHRSTCHKPVETH